MEVVTNTVTLPFEVEVTTNGTFTVAGGKVRKLAVGQIIRNDGWLVKTNGMVEPIIDHVAAVTNMVILRRDGHEEGLTEQMVFPNGLIVNPDGSCTYPGSAPSRLAEGQLFRFDGKAIHVMDAVTLINGKVMVQKDGGTPFYVAPLIAVGIAVTTVGVAVGAIGMCDGTLVKADGTMRRRDGSITVLREGHTVLIESFAPRRWQGDPGVTD
jgi:hypothetical protein